MAEEEIQGAERAMILDSMASAIPIGGAKTYLRRALEWAREAFRLCPNAPTVRGTLGSLLVENGEYVAGLALLEPLTVTGNTPLDRAISACYAAKACTAWARPAAPGSF